MKYASIETITSMIDIIKARFASVQHVHEINEVNGLQQKFDEIIFPPDIQTTADVIIKLNQLTNTVNALIPSVGEIYITLSEENPNLKFGGTWEQIKDVFLLASGDIYSVGSTGGEATHALTIEEMPSHVHTYKRHMLNRDEDGVNTGESGYGVTNKTIDIYNAETDAFGGGQAHNNMPPYLTVYVWKRVA